jgi:hypothetical protein
VHQDTARISLHGGRGELPGWFWGVLGCLSVLAVGLSVLFLLVRSNPGLSPLGAGPALAPAGSAAPAPASGGLGRGSRIQVEQLASPPSPALAPLPAPKPKAPPKGVKVAHSPTGKATRPGEGATAGAAEESDDDEAEEAPPPPPRKVTLAPREGRPRELPSDDESEEK